MREMINAYKLLIMKPQEGIDGMIQPTSPLAGITFLQRPAISKTMKFTRCGKNLVRVTKEKT
jgi:hypothetical protein